MRVYKEARYGVYNQKEELVFEGNAQECADKLGVSRQVLYSGICKKTKFKRKYEVVRYE